MAAPSKSPFAALAALRDAVPPAPAGVRPKPPDPLGAPSPFAGKLVVARTKRGRGGKTVTTVSGLRGSASELEEIARELRHALGCGGHVQDGLVVLSGEQESRARAFLEGKGARQVVMGTAR